MKSNKKTDYLDKDFFSTLDQESESISPAQTPEVRHVCITDTVTFQEIHSFKAIEKSTGKPISTQLIVGLGTNIPFWKKNQTLRWRLSPMFDRYSNAIAVKQKIRGLFIAAIEAWGDSSPVKFKETSGAWDFEIKILPDNCTARGCTLASAFFPNENQNLLILHPKMFTKSRKEQVETMIHELGHVFGLRHYFARERESSLRSEIFGTHYPLSIMNYGHLSTLTERDLIDLKTLYTRVWSGKLQSINGLPVQQYTSFTNL